MKTHKISERRLGDLKLAAYNPRRMSKTQMKELVSSLRRFGFATPLTVRAEDNVVVGGHQRIEAYRQLLAEDGGSPAEVDDATVPVVEVAGLSEPETKALNLALNKISGDWDYDKLAELLGGLDTTAMVGTGFDEAEVIEIIGNMEPLPDLPVPGMDTVDADVARAACRFVFEVEPGQDELVRRVLGQYGMTSPRNGATALVAALTALEDG